MTIEYEVSSLDAVEESLRGAYVEDGGKFKLDVDKYAELKAEPLKAKNLALLNEKKQLDKTLKATQPDKDRIADLEKQVKHYQLTTPLRDLLLKNRAVPEYADLMLMELEKRFGTDESGQLVVLDEAGNQTAVKPEDFIINVYQHQRGHLFYASGASGSGASNNRSSFVSSSKAMSRDAFNRLSPSEQMAFSRDGGTLTD
jgi:hypothetical protein